MGNITSTYLWDFISAIGNTSVYSNSYNVFLLDNENYDNDTDEYSQVLDPITSDPIPTKYMIKLINDKHYFVYNVLTLYEWINSSSTKTLPGTDIILTDNDKDVIFKKILSLNPMVYYIYIFDKIRKQQKMLPNIFNIKEDANNWINENKKDYPKNTIFTIFTSRLPIDINAYNLMMRYGHSNNYITEAIDIENT